MKTGTKSKMYHIGEELQLLIPHSNFNKKGWISKSENDSLSMTEFNTGKEYVIPHNEIAKRINHNTIVMTWTY